MHTLSKKLRSCAENRKRAVSSVVLCRYVRTSTMYDRLDRASHGQHGITSETGLERV